MFDQYGSTRKAIIDGALLNRRNLILHFSTLLYINQFQNCISCKLNIKKKMTSIMFNTFFCKRICSYHISDAFYNQIVANFLIELKGQQILSYRFSAFWLRSKCSICSYQLNIWWISLKVILFSEIPVYLQH